MKREQPLRTSTHSVSLKENVSHARIGANFPKAFNLLNRHWIAMTQLYKYTDGNTTLQTCLSNMNTTHCSALCGAELLRVRM